MESLQGLIDTCFLEDHLDVEWLEHGFLNTRSFRLGEEENEELLHFSEDKMPFLRMLQNAESQSLPFLPNFNDPNFHSLLKFQHFDDTNPYTRDHTQTLEPESCVTHETVLETQQDQPISTKENLEARIVCSSCTDMQTIEPKDTNFINPSSGSNRERRKRKRTKTPKNKEDVESQRMTHIAVERNRRRQMNDHLNCLRSLMPLSYVQRGDQASIVGGAIDFVKELEQLLQSLEAEKRVKTGDNEIKDTDSTSNSHTDISSNTLSSSPSKSNQEASKAESGCGGAKFNVTVIQSHVSLKVRCLRRQGLLLEAIVALEELRLVVLHLHVTTSMESVFYSFSLKMEDDCKLGSADEIAAAVHQIFDHINGGSSGQP